MKSNKDCELKPICTVTQFKNMYKKDRKITWFDDSESSKALLFLFFHKVQNKYKGVALHVFFLFYTIV